MRVVRDEYRPDNSGQHDCKLKGYLEQTPTDRQPARVCGGVSESGRLKTHNMALCACIKSNRELLL